MVEPAAVQKGVSLGGEESDQEQKDPPTKEIQLSTDPPYKLSEKENKAFYTYYKATKILDDAEFDHFYQTLKLSLPVCFRVNSVGPHSSKTQREVMKCIGQLSMETGDKVPRQVAWYPTQLAYTFSQLSRQELRSNVLLKKFHTLLIQETEQGRIFRQELVSMVPVCFLDLKEDHSVLDMCASPGSKTIQMLENLHQTPSPTGFVVANDMDVKRAYMLTHQARRFNSPCLFVTNHDARFFPNLKKDKQNFKFDRIACDVPCSGDGTLRKNLGLWKRWDEHYGHGHHPMQLDILKRGFALLKKGGRLVYSTCSFNPIENEAVVAAALTEWQGRIELVDVSQEAHKEFKYRSGMTKWGVYHKGKGKRFPPRWFTEIEQVESVYNKAVKSTMFHPIYTKHNLDSETQLDPLNLSRCMRVFPHDDNQGGFFVAVFTKLKDDDADVIEDKNYTMNAWADERVTQKEPMEELRTFVEEYEKDLKKYEEKMGVKQEESKQGEFMKQVNQGEDIKKPTMEMGNLGEQLQAHDDKEFPYISLLANKPDLYSEIEEYFGLTPEFPKHLLYFQQDTTRRIVLVSESLDQYMNYQMRHKLKVVNVGVKLFERVHEEKGGCKVRIVQEGVDILFPLMSESRKVKATKEMISYMLEKGDHSENFDGLKQRFDLDLSAKGKGSAIMWVADLLICIWIGVNNVSLMLSKEEVHSYKYLIDLI